MNKKEASNLTDNMLIADLSLKVKALIALLIKHKVLSVEDIASEMNSIIEEVSKNLISNNS